MKMNKYITTKEPPKLVMLNLFQHLFTQRWLSLSKPLLSLLLALSLVSCSNSIQPDSQSTTESTSNEQDIAYITLAEPTFGNNSRTISPNSDNNDYLTSSLHNLVFTGQKYDAEGNLGTEQTLAEAVNFSTADGIEGISGKKIPLEAGTWKLKLIATMSGAPMEGTIDNKVISNGTNTSISFSLSAPSSFKWGGCYLHLKFDNTGNKVSKIVLTLQKCNTDEVTGALDGTKTLINTKEFTSTDFKTVNSATKQIDYMRQLSDDDNNTERLEYGYYYVTFDFYKTYDAPDNRSDLLNSICEYMYIDQGHWTTWTSNTYNINDVYTIDYKYYVDDAEDSTYTPASGLVFPGAYSSRSEELIIPAITKEGYTFLGWYTDSAFTTRLPENASNQQVIAAGSTGAKDLYARFIKPELYVSSSATDDTGSGFTEAAAFKTFAAAISKINTFTTPLNWTIHIIGEVDMGTDDYKISNFYPEKLILAGKDDGTSKLKATSDNQNSVLWINDEDLEVEITNLTLTGCLKDVTQNTLGGGITIEKGTCTLSDGAIVTGNTAAYGDGIYVKPTGGILKIKGTAKVASDDTIYYYSNDSIIISDSLTGTYTDPVATIKLQNYNRTSAIVSAGTSELLAASYNRFLISPVTNADVTTMYKVGSDGKISSSLAAGDIVFTDNTVISYSSGLSFSNDAKAKAVGVIYNTDIGYIPRGIIGKVNSVNSSLVWCERTEAKNGFPDFVQYELENTDNIATAQIKESSPGDRDGSSNENTFRNHDSTSTYPAFDYVDNYKTTAGLTGTDYENDWYMPSIVEMLYIAQHVSDINNSLAKIGNQLSGRYWTPSLYADDDNMIWTVVINDCVEQYERNYNAEVCCVHQY